MVNIKDELTLDASLLQSGGITATKKTKLGNSLIYHQPICPYVSSTFVDLEEEFRYLHSNVFPQLNKLCNEHRSYFLPFDFRRTAIENRSSADLILKHALDNVLSSLPFFIGIIGSQYGPYRPPNSEPLSVDRISEFTSAQLSMMDQNLLVASEDYPWILESDFQSCSMMELEITLSCFLAETHFPKYCFFYIKEYFLSSRFNSNEVLLESESEYAQKRLYDLKSRIINKGFPVKFFSTKEELAEKILKDWSEIIIRIFPTSDIQQISDEYLIQLQLQECLIQSSLTKYHKHQQLAELEMKLMAHSYPIAEETSNWNNDEVTLLFDDDLYSRDEISVSGYKVGDGIFSSTANFLQSFNFTSTDAEISLEKSILAIVGDPGSGKTTFLANWLQNYRQRFPDVLILSEFVGVSHFSHDVSSFLLRCIRILREKYFQVKSTSQDLISNVSSYEGLVEAFSSSLHLMPCLIVIDEANDFHQSMGEDIGSIKGLTWLPKVIPPSCKVIITTRRSDLSYKVLMARNDVSKIWMPAIDLTTKRTVFAEHLKFHLINSLPYEVEEKIWANKLSELPLFLSILSNLLLSARLNRDRINYVEKCTSLRSTRDFWKCVFVLWSHRHSWNKNSPGQPGAIRRRSTAAGWITDSLKLIASSRDGLERIEIIHLLYCLGYRGRATVTPNDWEMFRSTAGSLLMTGSDGLIRVKHQSMLTAIRNNLFKTGRSSSRSEMNLIKTKHHKFHFILSSYFIKFGSMERKLRELPWQLQQSGDWLTLCQTLCKPRFFLSMCDASRQSPSLHLDHLTYWKELMKHDFDIHHCMQTMFDQSSAEADYDSLAGDEAAERSASLPQQEGSLKVKQSVTISAKAPSLIIVTQHDDGSIHKSTEDSKSETEDRDYSETESSFILADTEVDHFILASGWHPSEENPEEKIDDSILNENEKTSLHYNIVYLFHQLGEKFQKRVVEATQQAIKFLDQSRPLSLQQRLVFFQIVAEGCKNRSLRDVNLLLKALEIFDDLPLKTMNIPFLKQRDLQEQASALRLHIANKLMKESKHQKARSLILHVFGEYEKWPSIYCKTQAHKMFGRLLMNLNLVSQSEEMLIHAFSSCVRWNGKKHLSLASILKDLGRLYSLFFPSDRYNYRKALLAYKQALEIYKFNKLPLKAAKVSSLIGQILVCEGSLISKKEASLCFLECLDVYVTKQITKNNLIEKLTKQYKQVESDIKSGNYVHGKAKPADVRTTERPYSALSWRSHELNRLSEKEDVSPEDINKIKTQRKLMSSVAVQRPYSAFSARTIGNRVLVTPRRFEGQRLTASAPATRASSRQRPQNIASHKRDFSKHYDTNTPIRITNDADPQAVLAPVSPVKQRLDTTEGKEHPVIIVPAHFGKSGLETETPGRSEVDRPFISADASARSEVSTPKRSIRLRTKPQVINQSRPSIPKHHSNLMASSLPLTVHGPLSTFNDIVSLPASFRISARSVDVHHKSAWFHVPGRYTKPREVLPSKRSQFHKRPTSSAASSNFANRSYPNSRSVSRWGKEITYEELENSIRPDSSPAKIQIKTQPHKNTTLKEVMFAES